MADERDFTKEFRESLENKRIGSNFLDMNTIILAAGINSRLLSDRHQLL